MNVRTWFSQHSSKRWARRVAAPVLAVALAASFTTYEIAKPAAANAAASAPAAPPLDADSVSALLALDHAMENLAAHVTPAVVNVTVTSKAKPGMAGQQMPQDMQRFFGQGNPFEGAERGRSKRSAVERAEGARCSAAGVVERWKYLPRAAFDGRIVNNNRTPFAGVRREFYLRIRDQPVRDL